MVKNQERQKNIKQDWHSCSSAGKTIHLDGQVSGVVPGPIVARH